MQSSLPQYMISDEQRTALGRVGVLLGGRSAEREVSLNSGGAVMAALGRLQIEAVAIDTGEVEFSEITKMQLDRVFIALHGRGGEDGTLQGALELYGIPYTGCGVLASALAMDKLRSKMLWSQIDLPTPPFCMLEPNSDFAALLDDLGGKAMVKPIHEGSSIGMSIADDEASLISAYEKAAQFDSRVMAEQWIEGREYTVSILGDQVLPVVEMATSHSFYDYEAKYLSESTSYYCPADLPETQASEAKSIAMTAFRAIDGRGWGRVDLMADLSGGFQLLEANTVPGLTDHSLVPMSAKAAGISFDELIYRILEMTLQASVKGGAQ